MFVAPHRTERLMGRSRGTSGRRVLQPSADSVGPTAEPSSAFEVPPAPGRGDRAVTVPPHLGSIVIIDDQDSFAASLARGFLLSNVEVRSVRSLAMARAALEHCP